MIEDSATDYCYLLHDRDAKFTSAFDRVFAAQNIKVIHTPLRAPNADAYAERWVRSVSQECSTTLERIVHIVPYLCNPLKFYSR